MQSLPEGIQLATTPEQTHEMPQRREALSMYLLWKRLQRHVRLEKTHKNSYRCSRCFTLQQLYFFPGTHIVQMIRSSTLQVQFVREIVHSALFTGKPLPQSTRGGAPVRLQAKEVKGKREQTSQIALKLFSPRCTFAKTAGTQLQSPKSTIST